MAVSANKLELLQIADVVGREKSIDRGIVIAAMEDAIAKAARARYGSETDVHAEIDAKKGELRLSRLMLVVEQVENSSNQISLADAQRANPGAQVGDTIADTLPPLEYGRIAAQPADRRSSSPAPIRNSWRNCSRRKCRKSMTASSRSRRWPAIPARARKSA